MLCARWGEAPAAPPRSLHLDHRHRGHAGWRPRQPLLATTGPDRLLPASSAAREAQDLAVAVVFGKVLPRPQAGGHPWILALQPSAHLGTASFVEKVEWTPQGDGGCFGPGGTEHSLPGCCPLPTLLRLWWQTLLRLWWQTADSPIRSAQKTWQSP